MAALAQPARVDALDVFVELLSEVEAGPRSRGRDFYDRCCEAVCRMTSMRRAGLMLYDDARKLVVTVGSHGIDPSLLSQIHGTLEETPIAQRALATDSVVESSRDLAREVPERFARFAGLTTLTCVPVTAAGRRLGVIFADRGGGRFALTDEERHKMWVLGKTAALAASARIATTQHERSRLLSERIDLAREIHERVLQRLFGVSLVLSTEGELDGEGRRRCARELQAAIGDLRSALARPLAPASRRVEATLREELDRLRRHYRHLPLEVEWELDDSLPADLEPLAQSVLAEALRNVDKHAHPSSVLVRVSAAEGTLRLEVSNDGLSPAAGPGTGMGLRMAAFEALGRGGVVEFGSDRRDRWRVRLVVPCG